MVANETDAQSMGSSASIAQSGGHAGYGVAKDVESVEDSVRNKAEVKDDVSERRSFDRSEQSFDKEQKSDSTFATP